MKMLLVVCFLGLIVLSQADVNRECPAGQEHTTVHVTYGPHEINYCVTPGPSCEDPIPTRRELFRCGGFETCQCPYPTVKNTESGKCVLWEQCPKKEQETKK